MSIPLKLFLDAVLFPLTSAHVIQGVRLFEQQRRTAWKCVSSMRATCEMDFLKEFIWNRRESTISFKSNGSLKKDRILTKERRRFAF